MRPIVSDPGLQPIRNMFSRPDMSGMVVTSGGASGAYAVAISGAGPAGRPVHKVTWTTAPPPTQVPAHYTAVSIQTMTPVVPGRAYVFQGKVRSSQPWTVDCRVRWTDAVGSSTGFSDTIGTNTATAPGTWETRSVTAVAPAGAVFAFVLLRGPATGWTDGQVTEVTEFMITEGSGAVPPYSDGSFPGWAWTGASGQSESVGYPYTLESIAGVPLDVNTTTNSSRPGIAVDPFAPRSLYVVTDVLNTASAAAGVAGFGASSPIVNSDQGAVVIRTAAAAQNSIQGRIRSMDSILDATIQPPTNPAIRSVGRHVWMATHDGTTSSLVMADGANLGANTAASAGSGMRPVSALTLGPVTSSDSPVAAYVWAANHNAETRNRVTAWLARRYGSPIPAGY